MIDLFVGQNVREAQRIRQGLDQLGVYCRLIVDAADHDWYTNSLKLVDVTAFGASEKLRAEVAFESNSNSVALFGGEDKASSASHWLRRGAVDYFAHGESLQEIGSRVKQLQIQTPSVVARQSQNSAVFVGESQVMKNLDTVVGRVAETDISMLISGPSGVGKEVIARRLHQLSKRSAGPFVAINCAAIPEAMLEATLFGHMKGAFTGATESRAGKFELADGGTLLLDEITEMPMSLQAKLLRVLQEREVERIGSNQIIPVDVRVLATTNRDPLTAVKEHVLREDLYYRISVFPVFVPELCSRPDDIIPLAEHFLDKFGAGKVRLSDAARQRLTAHSWPGNVRELENVIQRALVLNTGGDIGVSALMMEAPATNPSSDERLASCVEEAEIKKLRSALQGHQGTRKEVASQLGISERTLRHKIKQLRDRGILI